MYYTLKTLSNTLKLPYIVISFYIIGLIGCSSDNELLPDEQPIVNPEDSIEQNIYLKDNQWIYAQMNEHYLWRNDLPDSLSCDYSANPATFFKSLLSTKDRFSYCSVNEYYSSGSRAHNWGFAYQEYKTPIGDRLLQVLYVTSKELKNQNLRRGEWLRFIANNTNKQEFERGILNDEGLFTPIDTIYSSRSGFNQQSTTVYLDSIYHIGGKRIGYLCYLQFEGTKDLEPSLKKFYENKIEELILDIRYNPGGYVSTCKYLCNSIVSEQAYGEIFQQCTYNDRLSKKRLKETGSEISVEYYDEPTNGEAQVFSSQIYGLNLNHIYVLTSKNSASASEATIVCLKPYTKSTIIGEQTTGKGVGSYTIADNQYRYKLQPITMRYHNALMETTPDEGLIPDIEVSGGYETVKKELGDINEPLLLKAIQCITTGNGGSDNNIETRSASKGLIKVGQPSFVKSLAEY